jgi:hypothetical protein
MTRIMPTSILGDTPAGQVDELERLQQKGIIDGPEDLADQILDPDVKAVLNRRAAPQRVIEKMVENMLEGGEYQPPEPFMNLKLAMMTAQAMYLEALEDGDHSESELRNVRKFMNAISSIVAMQQQKAAEANQQPTPGAPGGLPPGAMPPGALPPGAGPAGPQPMPMMPPGANVQ